MAVVAVAILVGVVAVLWLVLALRGRGRPGHVGTFDHLPDTTRTLTELQRLEQRGS